MSRELTSREQVFLTSLMDRFHEAGVIAIVLRNYASFPYKIGNDLDIFIPRKQHKAARNILNTTLAEHEGTLVHVYQKDSFAALWMTVDQVEFIHLDFYHGAYFWRGRQYLSDRVLIGQSRTLSEKNIKVPAAGHEALVLYVTSIIWGGFYKARYNSEIIELLETDDSKKEFFEVLQKQFNHDLSLRWFHLNGELIIDKEKVICSEMRSHIKWRWLKRCLCFRIGEAYTVSRYWLWELYSYLKPNGTWAISGDVNNAKIERLKKIYGDPMILNLEDSSMIELFKLRFKVIQRAMSKNRLVLIMGDEKLIDKITKKCWFRPHSDWRE